MKRNIAIFFIILCIASSSTAFARSSYRSHYDGYNSRHHSSHYNRYYPRYRDRTHHHDLGTFVAVAGGLLLVSALINSAQPSPSYGYYGAPYRSYEPIIVQQPRICFETRKVTGEWQINPYDGSQIWVQFAYPLPRRIQVPCH